MGGDNQGQVIDHVRTLDTRSWSCLHVVDGRQNCRNITVSNCDIGPCGLDSFNDWADGISFDCKEGVVINNMIQDPTDGGIVIFGSPGTLVRNNTIWVEKVSCCATSVRVYVGDLTFSLVYFVGRNQSCRFPAIQWQLRWSCRRGQRHHGWIR